MLAFMLGREKGFWPARAEKGFKLALGVGEAGPGDVAVLGAYGALSCPREKGLPVLLVLLVGVAPAAGVGGMGGVMGAVGVGAMVLLVGGRFGVAGMSNWSSSCRPLESYCIGSPAT